MRSSILAVTPWLMKPDRGSGDRRFFHILRTMAGLADVDVVVAGTAISDQEFRKYKTVYDGAGARLLRRSGKGLEAIVSRFTYDLVLYEFWHIAESEMPVVRHWQPWACNVVDCVDLHFSREEAGVQLGVMDPVKAEKNKSRELRTYRSADHVVSVSLADDQLLRLGVPQVQSSVIPNSVPLVERQIRDRGNELVFVGGFSHHPNVDGIQWFVAECWPTIKSSIVDAKLLIVGTDPPENVIQLGQQPGIEVTGYVPETKPYLDRAKISVAPLRYGGGMKGKVCEAMACGVPVVCTSVGAQGLSAIDGVHLRIEDSPERFSRAIIDLLRQDQVLESIGSMGQQLIAKLCSEDVVASNIRGMLSQLCPIRRRPLSSPAWFSRSVGYHAMRVVGQMKLGFPRSNPFSGRTMYWSLTGANR